MASACVNPVGMSPDSFLDCAPAKYPSYGWLSPRASCSREFPDEADTAGNKRHSLRLDAAESFGGAKEEEDSDPELSVKDVGDFEFRLDDPVLMLPADELFYDGKLMPLHLSMVRTAAAAVPAAPTASAEVRSPDTPKLRIRNEISSTDPYLFSPKAPRCSSRWKELLGLKKLYQNSNTRPDSQKLASSSSLLNNSGHKTLKNFLNRTSKSMNSSIDASLSLPLLRDSDNESLSVSSRLSLSSSSSGHEHDDLPRLSLDSEKPNGHTRNSSQNINPPRVRAVRPRASSSENPTSTATRMGRSPMRRAPDATTATAARGVSVDSPRMNSSGKIVFHSLERSSSSPSSFNGGPRYKLRGMERSYSANVRVTPVLNVPVCSLRGSSKSGGVFGFPLFSSSSSSQPRKESGSSSVGNGSSGGNKSHQSISKHRTDRIKE